MSEYRLDLKTLLTMLEELQQTGWLMTSLPPQVLGKQEVCLVRIELVRGKVVACFLQGESGRSYGSGLQVLQGIMNVGERRWTYEPQAIASSSSQSLDLLQSSYQTSAAASDAANEANTFSAFPIPKRTVSLSLQYVDRNSRKVLALIDGQRSVEKIAALSGLAIPVVLSTLQELTTLGVVTA
ncbi:hypothetical protein [Tengunoibacter tsumagoiensis]|uniref:DUF4388 domain-containing protein n=1 Tax=Tengunoibacter tsumagoiensis TaxID=2014871 RepID=A0A402AAE1_9CHLR|nr:hypothetical protein [Tengunoibacter tsumagoiensis]GCE16006.1 hypothetical protein KTT_58650 [Tengunoibacter tsumagoiensis]